MPELIMGMSFIVSSGIGCRLKCLAREGWGGGQGVAVRRGCKFSCGAKWEGEGLRFCLLLGLG